MTVLAQVGSPARYSSREHGALQLQRFRHYTRLLSSHQVSSPVDGRILPRSVPNQHSQSTSLWPSSSMFLDARHAVNNRSVSRSLFRVDPESPPMPFRLFFSTLIGTLPPTMTQIRYEWQKCSTVDPLPAKNWTLWALNVHLCSVSVCVGSAIIFPHR